MDVQGLTGPVEEDGTQSNVSIQCLPQSAQYEPAPVSTVHMSDVDQLRRRLNTFSNWNSKKSSLQLATAGFVYTGITDKVECPSCGIRLYNWQEDEDPLTAHKKYGPDCDFMLKMFPQIKAQPTPRTTLAVKYPRYSDYQTRLKSFDCWPLKCVAQKPEMMARSGFFYIGSADRARCFHCGVTLRDWDTDDYPPCAHRQWSGQCPFVQQIDVEGMKAEIEEWERLERVKLEDSQFIDCHSTNHQQDDVVEDGLSGATSSTHVYAQASDSSSSAYNPAVQAVVEMGYTYDVIKKALEIRRKEGCTNPDAVSIFEAIMDMELES